MTDRDSRLSVILFYGAGISVVLLLIIDFAIGLRASRADQLQGQDFSLHVEQVK